MSFTHLHVHSHYTLLTALGRPEELLAHAKELGQTALALTDTSALYGAVEFYTKAKDYGIKAIIGAEMYVCHDLHSKNNTAEDRRRHTIVLLVKNETGYKNLLKIISIAQLEGFYYKARTDKTLLRQYSEGLIALPDRSRAKCLPNSSTATTIAPSSPLSSTRIFSELEISILKSNRISVTKHTPRSIKDSSRSHAKRISPLSPRMTYTMSVAKMPPFRTRFSASGTTNVSMTATASQ